MVMEFSYSIMDVDDHEINTYHWKQFSEVSRCMKACDHFLFTTCHQTDDSSMISLPLVSLQTKTTGLE